MKKSRDPLRRQSSPLTLRAWEFTGTALLTLIIWTFLLVFLSPLAYMVVTSLRSADEFRDRLAPSYPAERLTYNYQGTTYQLYKVPTPDGVMHDWALVKPSRLSSQFIDPAYPEQGLITWEGSWRSLSGVFHFRIYWDNYFSIWKSLDYLHLFRNTMNQQQKKFFVLK